MGRYTGVVKKLPVNSGFGEIVSNQVPGLTAFFDAAAGRGASGPGGIIKGARVSFEIGGNGRAVNIIKGHSNMPNTGRHRYQSEARTH